MLDKHSTQTKLTIIADDLTGAMDTAGYFAARDIATAVVLKPGHPVAADVIAICTNTRSDSPAIAARKVKTAVKAITGTLFYKKIDSTLRGNIGAELVAAMDEPGYRKAIVAPAFPAAGRTTVNGILLVNGTPVSQTAFARDPGFNFAGSDITELFRQSTGLRVGLITIETVRQGPELLHREIKARPENILVCDAVKDSDLNIIARAGAGIENSWLLCGSAGLARELIFLFAGASPGNPPKSTGSAPGPILLVVGSRNPVTIRQLERAHAAMALPLVKIGTGRLASPGSTAKEVEDIATETRNLLEKGPVAVTASFSENAPGLEREIVTVLAETTAAIATGTRIGGLFLSGGDTAQAVCDRLKVAAIELTGEVEPGIPAGRINGGLTDNVRVVTKAGGFGTDAAIIKSLFYLEKGTIK